MSSHIFLISYPYIKYIYEYWCKIYFLYKYSFNILKSFIKKMYFQQKKLMLTYSITLFEQEEFQLLVYY